MKKNKVVFLDRDGVINYDYGYVYKKENLKFISGVIKSLKKLQELGYMLIIITNQSGIGRGYFTVEQYLNFTDYMIDLLKQDGINIEKVYYCPHTDEENCNCRKPKIGLFEKAINEYNIDLDNSYAIGDNERDLCICDKTKIKGIIVNNNSNKYIVKNNLEDAVNYIIEN